MKEMNLLETHLRSWEPRPPSAALKTRLFGARDRSRGGLPLLTLALRWLAPAAACVLLAAAVLEQPGNVANSVAHHPAMVALIASNQSPVASLSNGWAVSGTNFEWTNRNGWTSSIASFVTGRTN